jgi:hypothetical protein
MKSLDFLIDLILSGYKGQLARKGDLTAIREPIV